MTATANPARATASAATPRRATNALASQASLLKSSWKFDNRACSLRSMQKVIDAASQNIVAVKCASSETGSSSMLVMLERNAIVLTPVDDVHVAATVLSAAQLQEAAPQSSEKDADAEAADRENDDRNDLRPLPFCDFATGRRVSSFAFGTDAEGLLTCIEARFNDGGRLTLGAQGPQVQPASRRRVYAQAA